MSKNKEVSGVIHVTYLKAEAVLKKLVFSAGTPLLEVYASADSGLRYCSLVQEGEVKLYGIAEGPFSVPTGQEKIYTRLIKGPWPFLHIKREAFPVVWVNPVPERLGTFMRFGSRQLMPDGVMIAVGVPDHLRESDVEWLARHYPNYKVFRLHYAGPFIFVGQKAQKPVMPARERVMALWRRLTAPDWDVQYSPEHDLFRVPKIDAPIEPFEGFYLTDQEAGEIIAKSSLWEQAAAFFQGLHQKSKEGAVGQPPTPLHAGHLALMLAAGHLNGLVGEGDTAHLIRGRTTKSTYTMVDEDATKKTREFYQIIVTAVSPDGTYRELGKKGGS